MKSRQWSTVLAAVFAAGTLAVPTLGIAQEETKSNGKSSKKVMREETDTTDSDEKKSDSKSTKASTSKKSTKSRSKQSDVHLQHASHPGYYQDGRAGWQQHVQSTQGGYGGQYYRNGSYQNYQQYPQYQQGWGSYNNCYCPGR